MKKFLVVILACASWLPVLAQFNYQVELRNHLTDTLVCEHNKKQIKIFPKGFSLILDSAYGIKFADIRLNIKKSGTSNGQDINFVVERNSHVTLDFTSVDSIQAGKGYNISGIPFLYEQQLLKNTYLPRKDNFDKWYQFQFNTKRQPGRSTTFVDSIDNIIRSERKQYLSFVEEVLRKVRHSYIGYELFRSEFLNPKAILHLGRKKIVSVFENLDSSYYTTSLGNVILKKIEQIKSNTVGGYIKDFRFINRSGVENSLYEFAQDSKLLLIFTSRTCGACIQQIPIIKNIESQLGTEIKILYVSLDRSMDDWNKTLKNHSYPGTMTINLPPNNFSVDLQELFMVNYIPQLFLIDKEKRILYDNLSPYEDDHLILLKKKLGIENAK